MVIYSTNACVRQSAAQRKATLKLNKIIKNYMFIIVFNYYKKYIYIHTHEQTFLDIIKKIKELKLGDSQQFCFDCIGNICIGKVEQKQTILCLKYNKV